MVTGVGNATLYQENLVKGYLTIPKKPGVRPISIPHPLGWGGRTQFDFETAIPLLSSLPIPIEWFRHVVSYDNLFFDYNKLEKYRNRKQRYEIFSLEEILDTEKAEIENTSLFIDPKFPNFKHTSQIPQV